MSFAVPRVGADLLTRTTLQLDPGLSSSSLTEVTQTLQRVPGVLLAEMNVAGARVVVAHDAAVLTSALVAAAARTGVRAKVLAGAEQRAAGAVRPNGLRPAQIKYLLTLAALAFVSLALVDLFIASSSERRFASIVISAFWVFFFAQVIVARRP